jgi:tetratricopeptide (TPR) repeat protein
MLFHVEKNAGDPDAAARAIDRGTDLASNDAPFRSAKADLLHAEGEIEEAREIIDPLVEDHPHDTSIVSVFTKIALASGDIEEATHHLERLAAREDLAETTRAAVLTRLGEAYEKQGRYDEAFEAFRASNEQHPSAYDPDEFDRLVDMLIDVWTHELVERLAGGSAKEDTPVFIVGMPRSGTSLVEQIIAAHPRAAAGGELGILSETIEAYQKPKHVRAPALVAVDELTKNAVGRLGRKYARELKKISPKAARITDKMPSNYLHLGLILTALPGASVIHTTRDPLDTALSCYFQNFGPTIPWSRDPSHIARYYRAYRRVIDHWEPLFPERMIEVPYETLVDDDETQIRRIIDAIGLEWDDRCLRFYEEKRVVSTASQDQVRMPIFRTSMSKAAKYGEHAEPFARALREIAGVEAR